MQGTEGQFNLLMILVSIMTIWASSCIVVDFITVSYKGAGKNSRPLWMAAASIVLGMTIWLTHHASLLDVKLPNVILPDSSDMLWALLATLSSCLLAFYLAFFTQHKLALITAVLLVVVCNAGMYASVSAGLHAQTEIYQSGSVLAIILASSAVFLYGAFRFTKSLQAENTVSQWQKPLPAILIAIAISIPHLVEVFTAQYEYRFQSVEYMVLQLFLVFVAMQISSLYAREAEKQRRRRLEAKLGRVQKSERNLKNLIQVVEDAIVVLDETGTIVMFNSGSEKMFGYQAEEVCGKNVSCLIGGELADHHDQYLERYVNTGVSGIIDKGARKLMAQNKDGIDILVELTVSDAGPDTEGRFIGVMRDVRLHQRELERLSRLANHDPLTGLYNRVMFERLLEHAIDLSKRNGNTLAVFYIDVDDFKKVNDQYGHAVGDDYLRVVAARLTTGTRKSDSFARLGGDEFCMLAEDIKRFEDIDTIATKILKNFSDPIPVTGKILSVNISIGVAVFPDDADSYEELMECADQAMYRSKRHGKGQYSVFQTDKNSLKKTG